MGVLAARIDLREVKVEVAQRTAHRNVGQRGHFELALALSYGPGLPAETGQRKGTSIKPLALHAAAAQSSGLTWALLRAAKTQPENAHLPLQCQCARQTLSSGR